MSEAFQILTIILLSLIAVLILVAIDRLGHIRNQLAKLLLRK
jgi:hypothetical protein